MKIHTVYQSLRVRYAASLSAYQRLPVDQQRQLRWSGLLFAGLIVVFGILKPSLDFAYNAKAAAKEERALHLWMEAQAPAIRARNAQQAKPQTPNTKSLLTLASQTSEEYRLTFQRYEPGTDGKLALWLSATEFNQLLSWLDRMVVKEAVQIERVSINQTNKPGLVDAQIVLKN